MTTRGSSIYWVFFIVIIGMTIWMFMQQSRQQKRRKQLQSDVQLGEEVYTVGGLIGTVVSQTPDRLVLRLAENVEVPILRSAVGGKVPNAPSIK